MSNDRIFGLVFNGEEIHRETFRSMLIVALGGYVLGTIRPSMHPWWGAVLKVVIGAGLVVVAIRYHPGAERIASDWAEYRGVEE